MTPTMKTKAVRRPSARLASAVSESVPPSPLLSARSRISTYFSVTVMISAHTISDSTPSTTPRRDHMVVARRDRRLAEGVERAGTDVAIDDADAAERQRHEAWRRHLRAIGSIGLGGSRALVHAITHRGCFGPPLGWKAGLISPPVVQRIPRIFRGLLTADQSAANRIPVTFRGQIGRNRRLFPHQGNGDAAVRRHRRDCRGTADRCRPCRPPCRYAPDGSPSPARISRTALARSAESSHGP